MGSNILTLDVRPAGLEPATPCLEGRCSIRLSYGRKMQKAKSKGKIGLTFLHPCLLRFWSGRLDSNQRPLGPKPSALPGCATPR